METTPSNHDERSKKYCLRAPPFSKTPFILINKSEEDFFLHSNINIIPVGDVTLTILEEPDICKTIESKEEST
jgi:hypothetical protein